MRRSGLVALTVLLSACGSGQPDAARLTALQAESWIGPTTEWKLDPALPQTKIQEMRDRAYRYCFSDKGSDDNCLKEQDMSLFAYANAFRIVRNFRLEGEPVFPFAVAHKQDPAAFERIHRYCRSVYEDHGSRDARGLGPCMSTGVGADFFSMVPVP